MTMPCCYAGTSGIRRFEIFTGVGKRRDWPPEVKAPIATESYSGTESGSAVVRCQSVSISQLFTWRRLLRKQMEERGLAPPVASRKTPLFVRAVIAPDDSAEPAADAGRSHRRRRGKPAPIELKVGGAVLRIGSGADTETISAVITNLRA